MKWVSSLFVALWAQMHKDWRTGKYFPLAVIVFVWTSIVVAAYYLNHPQPEVLADSWSYLYVVNQMQHHGQLVNFWRLPGYPCLIFFIYALTGQGNLGAVSMAQGVLFIFSVVELYVLSALILRRAWLALLVSLVVGTNLVLLSNVKPIMSEGLALWELTTLALAVTLFLHTLRLRFFWLVVLCTLLLFFTRPEWMYLPPFLFAYLLLVICWRGVQRRFLAPIVLAFLLLYGFLGVYTLVNVEQSHFNGVTWIQNINLLGKVLQYRMVDEASPQDRGIRLVLDTYVKKGINDPYIILSQQPVLARNYAAQSGAFAKEIILHHPVEFLLKSVPIFFSSLTAFSLESAVLPGGPFGVPLEWLQNVFRTLCSYNIGFPLCALIWMLLLCNRKTRQQEMVQKMGGVVLLALYGIIVTTAAAYRSIDYARIYTLLDPLLFLTMCGTLLAPFLLLRPGWLRFVLPVGSSERRKNGTARIATHNTLLSPGRSFTTGTFKNKVYLLPLLFFALLVAGSSGISVSPAFANLVPLRCHQETDAGMLHGNGVGILFMTIENRGQDAGPSTMQLEFQTNSTITPQIKLDVSVPALPAGAYRYIMVDIPAGPHGVGFLNPVGQIKISLDVTRALPELNRADSVLITRC